MPIKRRLDGNGGGGTAAGVPVGGGFYESYPNLWEFIAEDHYEDGSSRETGTVTLFCESGRAKAVLKDKDAGMYAFVTAASYDALLDALEEGLYSGHLDWRREQTSRSRKT